MNLANKSWNQLHNNIMRVSDGRLHAVYSIWIILANTAYQARVSVASYPGSRGGGEREPGTHCLRMRLIYRHSGNSVIL